MSKKRNLVMICLLMGLASCSSISNNRLPSSLVESKNWEKLRDLKQRKVELSALSLHFQKKKNEEQLKKIKKEQKNINEKIIEIESNLTVLRDRLNHIKNEHYNWREEKAGFIRYSTLRA